MCGSVSGFGVPQHVRVYMCAQSEWDPVSKISSKHSKARGTYNVRRRWSRLRLHTLSIRITSMLCHCLHSLAVYRGLLLASNQLLHGL